MDGAVTPCAECGDDYAAEGSAYCTSCLELLEPDPTGGVDP